MSKKNEKRKRNLAKEKKNARVAIYPLVAALIFLGLGGFGLYNNSQSLDEYTKSKDIREVEATITDASLESDTAGTQIWHLHVKYEVDGTEYTDTTSKKIHDPRVSDTITVEVYKKSNGKYAIPEVTNKSSLTIQNLMMYASLALGGILLAVGIFALVTALRRIKEIKAKIQPEDEPNTY